MGFLRPLEAGACGQRRDARHQNVARRWGLVGEVRVREVPPSGGWLLRLDDPTAGEIRFETVDYRPTSSAAR